MFNPVSVSEFKQIDRAKCIRIVIEIVVNLLERDGLRNSTVYLKQVLVYSLCVALVLPGFSGTSVAYGEQQDEKNSFLLLKKKAVTHTVMTTTHKDSESRHQNKKVFSFLDNPEQYLKPKTEDRRKPANALKEAKEREKQAATPVSQPAKTTLPKEVTVKKGSRQGLEEAFNLLHLTPLETRQVTEASVEGSSVMAKAQTRQATTARKATSSMTPQVKKSPTVQTTAAYDGAKKVLAEVDPVDRKLPTDHFYVAQSLVPAGKIIKGGLTASMDSIDLAHRKATVINLKNPASRVSISDPEIASVVVISPTQIQLVGNQVGVASLLVWDEGSSDKYAMIDLNVHRDVSVLTKQMKMINPGIQVVPMAADDSVILTGEASSRQQAQLAVEIASAYFSSSSSAGSSSGSGGTSSAGNSLSPGTASPGRTPNIINLIQIKGEPSTKAEAVFRKLKKLDPSILMDVVPGVDGIEKVLLSGKVKTANVVSRAINIASVFYGEPGLKVVTGPGGNRVSSEASSDFQSATGFSNNMDINILQGSIITDASGNVVSMMEVAFRPQIRCRVKILDISRAALKQLGHNYLGNFNDLTVGSFSGARAPAAGAGVSSFNPTGTGSGIAETATEVARTGTTAFSAGAVSTFGDGVTQFFNINQKHAVALSALVEKRKVRIVAEPTLVSLSGEKASFLAGGEIPIPAIGSNGQIDIEYHEFGVRLNLVATAKDDGKIHLQVAPEISSIDNTNAVTSNVVVVPAFTSRRFQTTVELNDGESFVMAGLFSQDETDSVSKFPGIGSLPIIGSFFRNKFTDRRDREMVVIIQPEVIMVPNEIGQKASADDHGSGAR